MSSGLTLVTGATGLVGWNIVQALRSRGRRVRVLVRDLDKARRSLPGEVEFAAGDVTDLVSVQRAVDGASVVYHCAGLPEQWLRDDRTFDRVNAGGTENLVQASLHAKVARFVYTSTIDVFAADDGAEYDESVIDPAPKGTAYERSKQRADRIVTEALDRGLPAVFLHPSALYGPGPAGSPGLDDLLVKLHRGQVPMLLPGGMPVVFSEDVASGHVLAEERAAIGSRYILSESFRTLTEIAGLASSKLGKKTPPVMPLFVAELVSGAGELISRVTRKPPLIPRGQLHFLGWGARPSSARAQRELGWKPIDFDQGLDRTLKSLGLS